MIQVIERCWAKLPSNQWLRFGIWNLFWGTIFVFGYPSFITEYGFLLFPIISFAMASWSYLRADSFRLKFFVISCFCLGINLAGYYWIPQTIHVFSGLPVVVSYILSLLFSFLIFPQFYLFAIVQHCLARLQLRFKLNIIVLAFSFSLIEYILPLQFPVFQGHAWIYFSPVLGLAPIFGVSGYSFISYLIALTLTDATNNHRNLKFLRLPLSLTLIGVALSPFTLTQSSLQASKQESFKIRIVQANIGNFMKVASEYGSVSSLREVYNRYRYLSTLNTGFKPDIIIWPETAYPRDFNSQELKKGNSQLHSIFLDIISKMDAAMLIGGYDSGALHLSENNIFTEYNSAFLFNRDGQFENVYHKRVLIPFGETLPFGPFNKDLIAYAPGVSLFAQGSHYSGFTHEDKVGFITPICYEILKPEYLRSFMHSYQKENHRLPHFIINLTNDSWFGHSSEPYHHLYLSKWRALEFQIPVVRATNTGITSILDINGRESTRLLSGEQKILEIELPIITRLPSIYLQWGILPFALLFLCCFIFYRFIIKD